MIFFEKINQESTDEITCLMSRRCGYDEGSGCNYRKASYYLSRNERKKE